jgi:coenzyme F420 hydrogenase subunit beta
VDRTLFFSSNIKRPQSIIGENISSYLAFSNDPELRHQASSGGTVTSLLDYALEERLIDGVIVTKMPKGKYPQPSAFVATTKKEIHSAMGSKYAPVSFASSLRALKKSGKYWVVGLPCHLYSIKALSALVPEFGKKIQLYLGLICGGMPTYLATEHLFNLFGLEKKSNKVIKYRGGGWPGKLFLEIEDSDGIREISAEYPDYWHGSYVYFQPNRCLLCSDCFNQFADISFGDAWIRDIMESDRKGTSLVITRTKKGEQLFQKASDAKIITFAPLPPKDAETSQRALISFKISSLRARIDFLKAMGQGLPEFDTYTLPSSNALSYARAIEMYLVGKVANRNRLWWFFDRYLQFRCATAVLFSRLF